MPTTITWKRVIDLPRGRSIQPLNAIGGSSATHNVAMFAKDLRGRNYAHPYVYYAMTTANLIGYNTKYDSWQQVSSATLVSSGGLTSTDGQHICQIAPSQGPKGTLSTGNSTTKVVLSTALPASVGINQLCNRGDGLGYIIRIIGNAAGSSGKIEERRIVANTSGTTPTLFLDEALSFTPASGDAYELLSGRIYFIASNSNTAGAFRYFDLATQSVSGNLSTTNMPSLSGSNSQFIPLDESYVSYNRFPGEGFLVGAATYDAGSATYIKGCLTATATAAGTITGQASSGDAAVAANEFRNFQIRIVEDTTTPTAVGQRRRITSHTAGASAVYTLASNWTVTPSTTAKFVIELDNDKVILLAASQTTTYNYNHTANTWDTTTWAARGSSTTHAGLAHHLFGVVADVNKNVTPSQIISPRFQTTTYDLFDISAASTGSWTNGATMLNQGINYTAIYDNNSVSCYVPWTQNGRYIYVQNSASSNQGAFGFIQRIDVMSRSVEAWATTALTVETITNYLAVNSGFSSYYYDNGTYVPAIYTKRPGSQTQWSQYLILD